jgi:hypothetical protein
MFRVTLRVANNNILCFIPVNKGNLYMVQSLLCKCSRLEKPGSTLPPSGRCSLGFG